MSKYKLLVRVGAAVAVLSLLFVLLCQNRTASPSSVSDSSDYADTLFDTSRVHQVDIVIDDWDAFLDTAAEEKYTACTVIIDGETVENVAIRGKGNTSLATVAALGSRRYSFKLEFDHYDSGKTYRGLDKLCLNNLIQDNTCMKDYLAYRLMAQMGVNAPLCSYVYVTVNGRDWGLYLAVEGVEDAYLSRVHQGEGALYKPDSISMGGGPGNGREFDAEGFLDQSDGASSGAGADGSDRGGGSWPAPPSGGGTPPSGGGAPPSGGGAPPSGGGAPPDRDPPENGTFPQGKPGGPGGPDSGDVSLQYSDDDPASYPNIFDNAKTSVSEEDQARLIRSLKVLSEEEDPEPVLDVDQLLRYYVVHNYLVNSDSYTGVMVHNYYLYESDGRLSLIPWDYNLAFGTFRADSADGAVNDPIDTPLSVRGDGSRPLADWIFRSEEYTARYHQLFGEFLDQTDVGALIDETFALIAPYVRKDPTAFCSYEEFETGVAALRSFCEKRTASVRGQLDGTIPSTAAGQEAEPSARIDASDLDLRAMGTMDGLGQGGPGGPDGMSPPGGPGGMSPPGGPDGGSSPEPPSS